MGTHLASCERLAGNEEVGIHVLHVPSERLALETLAQRLPLAHVAEVALQKHVSGTLKAEACRAQEYNRRTVRVVQQTLQKQRTVCESVRVKESTARDLMHITPELFRSTKLAFI